MDSGTQELRLAVTLLMQARVLCAGALDFLRDNADHAGRLDKIGAALGEECAVIERVIASMGEAHGDNAGGAESAPSAAEPSRIEQLHAELLECERLNNQLDELSTTFDSTSGEHTTSEDVILKSNADFAEKRLLDRMETLANCLALERPAAARDTLIFALRALGPLQELLMAVPEYHGYERKQGCIAYRLLQNIVPALEQLAGITRAELGFEEPQTEAEIIENLKAALAHKATLN
jgi:hypothetical protein